MTPFGFSPRILCYVQSAKKIRKCKHGCNMEETSCAGCSATAATLLWRRVFGGKRIVSVCVCVCVHSRNSAARGRGEESGRRQGREWEWLAGPPDRPTHPTRRWRSLIGRHGGLECGNAGVALYSSTRGESSRCPSRRRPPPPPK